MKINFLHESLGLGKGVILTFLWIPTEKQMTYAPKKLAGDLLNVSQIFFRKFIKTLFGNGQVLASHSEEGNLSPCLKNSLVTWDKEIIIIPSCVVLWWKTVAWWEKCQGQCNERPTVNSDLISEVRGGWQPGEQSVFCGSLENTF